jgi:HAE1 family hydrophobic/amphiphilic exporter-1
MASSVAAPLERQFGQIAGITQMTSISTLGSTTIVLQFELNRNIDGAAQDVQGAITAAGKQLPLNLFPPPTYKKVNPADSRILILSARSDALPLTQVDDYADNILAQQISQVQGVAQVTIAGEQKPSVRVQIEDAAQHSPDRLQTARRQRHRHGGPNQGAVAGAYRDDPAHH